jgi:hypothetical protein
MKDPLYTKLWHDLLAVLPSPRDALMYVLLATAILSAALLVVLLLWPAD